ncbi:MAG: hypothetical protein ACFFE6_02390 [Candidatus Thorarchaeota archaeon]
MTIEVKHEEILQMMELERSKKDMVVLGALLKAQKEPSDFIDFESIREQLAKDEGGRKGKDSLVYRSLSWLEKEGFLRIDKSQQKHGYNSSIAIIERALKKRLTQTIKGLERELKNISSEEAALSEINVNSMAEEMVDFILGKRKIEKPTFAQGWEDFMKMIKDKVYSGLSEGDVIRITLEWVTQHDYMSDNTLNDTVKMLARGVDFRSLDHDRGEKVIRDNFRKIIPGWRKKGYKAGYKVLPRKDATYQFVGRNKDGIVLVVSESPFSVTWIPRSSNPELVDSAIDSFDRDYEIGIDIVDYEG